MFLFIYFDFDPLTEVVMDRVREFRRLGFGFIWWALGFNIGLGFYTLDFRFN